MFLPFAQTHGLTPEEMPELAAGADFALTQESHGRIHYQPALFVEFSLGSIEGRFAGLNGALHKLLSGRWMDKGKNLRSAVTHSENNGADFLNFAHQTTGMFCEVFVIAACGERRARRLSLATSSQGTRSTTLEKSRLVGEIQL